MAKKEVWNFECPQYVDFEREFDSSGKDDLFFDCKDKSPESEKLCKTPAVESKRKGLSESDENRLLSKMVASLSVLENTPKIKKSASKAKLFSEKFSKDIGSKSTVKPNTVPAPLPKSRRSRSFSHLNKVISGKTNKVKKYRLHRSSSLNDLRTEKKSKYPFTPMCLRRTIVKAKEKIIKTTEEMELEKIAKLQKQMIEHLRQNEITLRKLNLKPRQYAVSKTQAKSDGLKEAKGLTTLGEKSNVANEEPRRNIRMLNPTAVKKEATKLNTIINNEAVLNKKTDTSIYSKKTKSVSDIDPLISKGTTQKTKKPVRNRILDHSGLIFLPSVKSKSTTKPFIFETKMKEMKSQTVSAKQKETSVLNLNENYNKENIPNMKHQFDPKKVQYTQNAKCDINTLMESNKTIGKRTTNPLRGVPLSENFIRN